MKLKDQVVIVTAAGRGIGRGIALALAAQGARLVVNSYSDETLTNTVSAIRELGAEVTSLSGDITDPVKMIALRDLALSEFGQIDILVNNVGAGPKQSAKAEKHELGLTASLWDGLYEQNLKAVVLMTEAVIPHMKQRRNGKVINISSIAGRTSMSDKALKAFVHPAYGAMKASLISYTQTQAEMLGPFNINVNAVCPGIVYTDAWKSGAQNAVQNMPEYRGMDAREWFEGIAKGNYPDIFDRTPLRREQTVEDIGNAVVFLVSQDSMNITGQSLMVDGGMVKL
jgi:NAD(P)-dependent dehydrogenase (short-subunit alcohol dehydrogenase family)